jgi:hypothetical protein
MQHPTPKPKSLAQITGLFPTIREACDHLFPVDIKGVDHCSSSPSRDAGGFFPARPRFQARPFAAHNFFAD